MGVPTGVTHVVYGGALPGGEVWESGFWTQGANPTTSAAANSLAALWLAQLTASDGSGGVRISLTQASNPGTNITYCKVYVYNDGSGSASVIGAASATAVAGTGALYLPNQLSIVVSLRTNLAGRQNRGRMYLPATSLSTAANGNASGTQIAAIATGWGLCFSDWNASGSNGTIVVVSRTGAGHYTPVTAVVVDSVVDTQRRRRNKLVAATISVVNLTH